MATISYTIDAANFDEFKECFLMSHPNITIGTDNPLSDNAWIAERIRQFAYAAYKRGKEMANKPELDDDIILID